MSTTEYYDGHIETKPHPSLKDALATAEVSLRSKLVRSVKVFKAGRNEPCPCGSGKKFKKCCWNKTGG